MRRRWKWRSARAIIFQKLARELAPGLEKDLCGELAAEEEEHVALLLGELEQME